MCTNKCSSQRLSLKSWIFKLRFKALFFSDSSANRDVNLRVVFLTCPCFSLGIPWQALISWPVCPQRPQGRGLLGLNSSLMIVKFGSCVARPSMIRSADMQRKHTVKVGTTWLKYKLVIQTAKQDLLNMLGQRR